MNQTETRHALPFVATAAAIAVGFWSLKPILISEIGDRASYLEVYLVAGAISVFISLLIVIGRLRDVVELLKSRRSLYGVVQSAIAGLCLAAWYYGFYRALYGSSKVEATIIAFSWPLIAVFAMRLFAPDRARSLNRVEFALVAVAFFGAISIGIAQLSGPENTGGFEILYAFLAAIGSGFYLPFALNGAGRFHQIAGSKVFGTFVAISVANLVAFLLVGGLTIGTKQQLLFYAFDAQVMLLCAVIGIGTYLVAEITWTWAFSEYRSLTLTSLPYFSPALSVVMLFVFYNEPVSALAAFGLTLILFSNLSLHGMYQSNNAVVLSLVGTLYVALASALLPRVDVPVLPEMLALIAGVFAILSGFILSRVSNRRAAELDQRAIVTRDLLDQRMESGETEVCTAVDDQVDAIFRGLIDLEYEENAQAKDVIAERLRTELKALSTHAPGEPRYLLRNFDLWYTIHRDRLSIGEKLALWITGGSSILFLTLLRPDNFFGQIGLYAFSAGCFLLIFTISDYERNNVQGFRKHILRLQQAFREMGRGYYLPSRVVATHEVQTLPDDRPIRYRAKDGTVQQMVRTRDRSSFRIIYLACSGLLVCALIFLPTSAIELRERGFGRVMRPDAIGGQVVSLFAASRPQIVIGHFDWDSSVVIAHILADVLRDELGVNVDIRRAEVTTIFSDLADPRGRFDVHPDFWLQNQIETASRFVFDDQTVQLNAAPYLGLQGIYMPAEAARALSVEHVADLADPAIAVQFDTNGDGKGEIWLGAPGWVSTRLLDETLSQTGLSDLWTFESYSETIFKARLQRYIESGQNIIFYGYEPDWIHAAYDLARLSDDEMHDKSCLRLDQRGRETCGFDPIEVHVAFGAYLTESHPDAAEILSRVQFSNSDVNQWVLQTSIGGATPADVAKAWRTENQAAISAWLVR